MYITLRMIVMSKKKFKRSILIVCEGTKTEYDYFNYIGRNISIPKGIWDIVDVSTNTTIPNDIAIPPPTLLGARKKKHFVNPNKKKIPERNIMKELCIYLYGEDNGVEKYEDVKAVPLRYVALAQMIEEEKGMYEELWAVFDKDDHSHHKEAYEKAEEEVNGKKVNIGFTSRSFEHWLLLHFEKNKNEFLITECKDENDKVIGCNKTLGCQGAECLCGYIRVNTPLEDYSKSKNPEDFHTMMEMLLGNLSNAFENAECLREEISNDANLNTKPHYELNPYTDVDLLIKRLVD